MEDGKCYDELQILVSRRRGPVSAFAELNAQFRANTYEAGKVKAAVVSN